MKIVLIRHGMTEGNIQKKFIGSGTDQGLAKEGKDILKTYEYPEVDIVFASPMARCIETAEIIYSDYKINIIDDLREIDFGDFEGKSHNELDGNQEYQNWLDSGGLAEIPNGESFEEFGKRCCNAFVKALHSTDAENIAFVVHGGTIMSILYGLGGYNYFDHIADNGKGYICSFENNKIKVEEKL